MYTVHTAAHGNECINEQNEIKQKIKPTQSKESTDCEGRMNSWMEIHNYRINRKIVHAISNSRVCAVCMCVRVTTLMCLTPRSRAYWFIPFNTLVLLTIWLTVWRCFCLTVNVILLNANKCLPVFFSFFKCLRHLRYNTITLCTLVNGHKNGDSNPRT